MRILVVEDDPLVRVIAVEALLDEGFEVVDAESGEEALRYCRRGWADVLFTDIHLPGAITGWDLAERCRETKPDLHVIYATGFTYMQARPVPGSVWFQKPYRPEQVVSAIRSFAQRQS